MTRRAKEAKVLYSASYALIIGVSHYINGWDDLPGAADDVRAVKEVLSKHGFRVQEVLNPTRQGFDLAMRDFIARYGQNQGNRLMIYFAGHGATLISTDGKNRRTGYLVPADAPRVGRSNVGDFKRFAISMNEIDTYAREINSKHALFVLDCCFSGVLHKRRGELPFYIADKLGKPVRLFITAGSAEQSAWDRSLFCRQSWAINPTGRWISGYALTQLRNGAPLQLFKRRHKHPSSAVQLVDRLGVY